MGILNRLLEKLGARQPRPSTPPVTPHQEPEEPEGLCAESGSQDVEGPIAEAGLSENIPEDLEGQTAGTGCLEEQRAEANAPEALPVEAGAPEDTPVEVHAPEESEGWQSDTSTSADPDEPPLDARAFDAQEREPAPPDETAPALNIQEEGRAVASVEDAAPAGSKETQHTSAGDFVQDFGETQHTEDTTAKTERFSGAAFYASMLYMKPESKYIKPLYNTAWSRYEPRGSEFDYDYYIVRFPHYYNEAGYEMYGKTRYQNAIERYRDTDDFGRKNTNDWPVWDHEMDGADEFDSRFTYL
jgi:hypothetical protein